MPQKENFIIRNEILKKNKILENAKQTLKKEFFGIDDEIDKLIDLIRGWYIFPYMQSRPTVINLWGMTGVGKTELLFRLLDLINKKHNYLYFDLRNYYNDYHEYSTAIKNFEVQNKQEPSIYIFDEFQFARSIDEEKKIKVKNDDVLWQILSQGYFYSVSHLIYHEHIFEIIKVLNLAVNLGVKVKNGVIVEGCEIYNKVTSQYIHSSDCIKNNKKLFFPVEHYNDILEIADDYVKNYNELEKLLLSFNEVETLEFLDKIIIAKRFMRKIDCKKSLIFIVGNLDKAYKMQGNLSPDFSADEFYKQTKKINLQTVKETLLEQFSPIEISRLGNNHIVFPALNSEAYKKIIKKELKKISEKYKEKFGIPLTFEESLEELIYKEAVFPTLGARQIFSTVGNIVESNIPKIYYEKIIKELEPKEILFSIKNDNLIVTFNKDKKTIHKIKIGLNLSFKKQRTALSKEKQAITAVHESGHAILATLLLNKVPYKIVSFGQGTNFDGITFFYKEEYEIISKTSIIKYVATYLGGYVAEKVVFGEENITLNSNSDIKQATEFATSVIKNEGMGSEVGNFCANNFSFSFDNCLIDHNYHLNNEVKTIIKNGVFLAEKILEDNKSLLLHMANYLAQHSVMNKDLFLDYLERFVYHKIDIEKLIEGMGEFQYLKVLKEELNNLQVYLMYK